MRQRFDRSGNLLTMEARGRRRSLLNRNNERVGAVLALTAATALAACSTTTTVHTADKVKPQSSAGATKTPGPAKTSEAPQAVPDFSQAPRSTNICNIPNLSAMVLGLVQEREQGATVRVGACEPESALGNRIEGALVNVYYTLPGEDSQHSDGLEIQVGRVTSPSYGISEGMVDGQPATMTDAGNVKVTLHNNQWYISTGNVNDLTPSTQQHINEAETATKQFVGKLLPDIWEAA